MDAPPAMRQNAPEDRWRQFTIAEVAARDFKLDGLKVAAKRSPVDDSDESAGAGGIGGGRDCGTGTGGGGTELDSVALRERE